MHMQLTFGINVQKNCSHASLHEAQLDLNRLARGMPVALRWDDDQSAGRMLVGPNNRNTDEQFFKAHIPLDTL